MSSRSTQISIRHWQLETEAMRSQFCMYNNRPPESALESTDCRLFVLQKTPWDWSSNMLKRLVETHSDGSHEDLKQRNGMFLFRRNLAVTFLPRLWCHWKEQLINRSWIVVSLNNDTSCRVFKTKTQLVENHEADKKGDQYSQKQNRMAARTVTPCCIEWHRKFNVNSTFITGTNDKFHGHAGYLKRTSKRTGIQFHDAETNPERDCKNSVTSPADQIGPFTFYHVSHSFVSDGTFAQSLLFDMNY